MGEEGEGNRERGGGRWQSFCEEGEGTRERGMGRGQEGGRGWVKKEKITGKEEGGGRKEAEVG